MGYHPPDLILRQLLEVVDDLSRCLPLQLLWPSDAAVVDTVVLATGDDTDHGIYGSPRNLREGVEAALEVGLSSSCLTVLGRDLFFSP